MTWIRVDCDRHAKPRFRHIGPWGSIAVQAAWEIAKRSSAADGTISTMEWTAAHLAWWTMFDREPGAAEKLEDGMRRAEECGLVMAGDAGRVELRGWLDYQVIGSDAERQRRRRARLATPCHVTSRDSHTQSRDVTPTGQDRTDSTGQTGQTGQEEEKATAPRKRSAVLPSEHWAWGLVDSYHAGHGSEPVNRGAEAAALAALERIDGHPAALVAEVLAWVATDVVDPPRGTWAGWAGVVRSLVSLRQRRTKGDASKFEKALAQYRDSQKKARARVETRAEELRRYPSAPATAMGAECPQCHEWRQYVAEGCPYCCAEPLEPAHWGVAK
jgi:hypothetical protein